MRPIEFRISVETSRSDGEEIALIADLIEEAGVFRPDISEDQWIEIINLDLLDAQGIEMVMLGVSDKSEWIMDTVMGIEYPVAEDPSIAERQRKAASIRGIHPDLRCSCPDCGLDTVELQWFSVDEQRKTRGQVMLFCGASGMKYFTPADALSAWLEDNHAKRRQSKK